MTAPTGRARVILNLFPADPPRPAAAISNKVGRATHHIHEFVSRLFDEEAWFVRRSVSLKNGDRFRVESSFVAVDSSPLAFSPRASYRPSCRFPRTLLSQFSPTARPDYFRRLLDWRPPSRGEKMTCTVLQSGYAERRLTKLTRA